MVRQLDLFESFAESENEKKSVIPDAGIPVTPPEKEISPKEKNFYAATSQELPPVLKEDRKNILPAKKGKRGRKSLKEMDVEHTMISIPEDEELFKKQYYSIGEVAEMFKLNTSLLRYWETEFDILKPRKNRKGDRFFRPEDIKNLFLIHHLLRQRKYTIEGARDYLKNNKSRAIQNFDLIQSLEKLKDFLLELKAGL